MREGTLLIWIFQKVRNMGVVKLKRGVNNDFLAVWYRIPQIMKFVHNQYSGVFSSCTP